eukprot:14652996-Alexandrium_andersonii.AAC.1
MCIRDSPTPLLVFATLAFCSPRCSQCAEVLPCLFLLLCCGEQVSFPPCGDSLADLRRTRAMTRRRSTSAGSMR